MKASRSLTYCLASAILLATASLRASEPLPSWNNTATKKAIVSFLQKVTTPGSSNIVPEPERIATFDNYGTL